MGPKRQSVDAGYYVTEILQKYVSQPCAGRQHRLGSDEENGARDVTANLPATLCTGAHVQGSLTVVPRERGGLLGQEHIARERTGPQSIPKSLGSTESGARQNKALLQCPAAHGASQVGLGYHQARYAT